MNSPPHSRAAHAAITTELVRLTLGGRPHHGARYRSELLAPVIDDRTQHRRTDRRPKRRR